MNENQKENQRYGYIKLFRSLKSHWLLRNNSPKTKFEAWLIILFEVNHKDQKVCIGNKIYDCKRGESLNSYDTWAKEFNWNKSKVRRFFNTLKKENMIETKSVQKTTHLKVCNYGIYQDERHANGTQTRHKRHVNESQTTPNKNGKNDNKEKKENILVSFDEKDKKLIQFISQRFSISEVQNPDQWFEIGRMIGYFKGQPEERNRYFRDTVFFYFKYKEKSGEKTHGFRSFIGKHSEGYADGGWNADNWIKKYRELTTEKKEETKVYPGTHHYFQKRSKEAPLIPSKIAVNQ